MSWIAQMIHDPANKQGTAIVPCEKNGAGNNSIVATYIAKLAPHHSHSISQKLHILGNFNAHAKEALFVIMEETHWAGDKGSEGVLKDLITGDTRMIEPKGVDAIKIDNHLHLWLVSNEDWIVPATEDERRFFVLNVSDEKRGDIEYFKVIVDQMENGGLEAMMYDLQHLVGPKRNKKLRPD